MKGLVVALFVLSAGWSFSQSCYTKLADAFEERGSYTVADGIHRKVVVSFLGEYDTTCVYGKVRVENGTITNIFLQYEDDTFEPMVGSFYNSKKMAPVINNGVTEMIYTEKGERFKILFIDRMKPKQKAFKEVVLPEDL